MAKLGKFKLINCAKIVRYCLITRDTCKKTHAYRTAVHLTTFKNRAPLLQVHKMLQDVRTNVRALHCDNSDRIRSRLNDVHAHYFEET